LNGPTFAAGMLDNGLTLASTFAQYATLPSGIVSGFTDFTVSTWIKVNTFATWQRIFDFGTGTTNYMFLTTQYGTGGSAAKLRFAIRTASVAEQSVSGTIALVAGSWTHVAVTRSGTTVSIYVNGSLAGSGTITSSPSDLGTTTLNYLGKSQFGSDPYLDAALDDFRLYSQALSASAITSLASPLAAPQNLVATRGPQQIGLTWSAVPNATRYTVKYATVSGGPYAMLASGLSATNYLHSGLSDETTCYYVVSAGNSFYEGPFSAEVSATTYTSPEKWRFTYFGTADNSGNAADSADPDGDGTTNADEYAAGTNPTDRSSVLRVSDVEVRNNDVVVSFPTVSGKTYRLDRSDTLQDDSWSVVQDNIAGTGGIVQITDAGAAASSKSFYRIVLP